MRDARWAESGHPAGGGGGWLWRTGARMAPFTAGPNWGNVRIGLGDGEATAMVLMNKRAAGEKAWLEIDNLRHVRR